MWGFAIRPSSAASTASSSGRISRSSKRDQAAARTSESLTRAATGDDIIKSEKGGARTLREGLESGKCLVGPGVFDGISAAIANRIGFDFLYLSGSGEAFLRSGEGDLPALPAMSETMFFETCELVVANTRLPVIIDAVSGSNSAAIIRQCEQVGIAGCHIDDRLISETCGQLEADGIVDVSTFVERVEAAVEARIEEEGLVLIARTAGVSKLAGSTQSDFEDMILRLQAAANAGADMVCLTEMPATEVKCVELIEALAPTPVLINVSSPSGHASHFDASDYHRLGFAAAAYPCTAVLAMQQSFADLRANAASDRG